jgi:hypothetical protein
MMKIDSQVRELNRLSKDYSAAEVKAEPMFFNASWDFAYRYGGHLTRDFLEKLDESLGTETKWVIDTKSCMLMNGWYPCIPGWHHDDVPRERKDGQPDYLTPSYRSNHVLCLAGDDICRTEFALGEAHFPYVPVGELIYKNWHSLVDRYVENKTLESYNPPMHRLVAFNDRSWHQGVKAYGNGWRWFARASCDTARVNTITNEIRTQVQVYLDDPLEGW